MSGNRAERRAAQQRPQPQPEDRYGRGRERRALLPAAIAAMVLIAGLLSVGQDSYVVVRYAVAILALITAVFVYQAKQWAWIPAPVVVAVLWNPVIPFGFSGTPLRVGHMVAAAALLATGLLARGAPTGSAGR